MPRTRNIDKWLGECEAEIRIMWEENGSALCKVSLNYPTEPYVPGYRTFAYENKSAEFYSYPAAEKWLEIQAQKWGKANNIILVRDGFRIGHAA